MWIELKAKMVGNSDFETQAIDTTMIDIVKPGNTPDETCWIWSNDAYPMFEVQMPYKALLEKLNGEDLKQPEEVYESPECPAPHVSFPLRELVAHLKADMDCAWSWHCNLAMPMQDEGVSHEQANRAAARIMFTVFGVDVTQHKHWERFKRSWESCDVDVKQDACPRKEHNSVEVFREKGFDVRSMHAAVGTSGNIGEWFNGCHEMADDIVVGHLQADFINQTLVIPESIRFVPKT